jgi:hypothetical protein
MAETRTFGIKSIKMGPVGPGGSMGTDLTLLGDGNTLEGTASFTKEEDEEKKFNSEESDDPIEVILKKGASILEFAIVDFTPATLVRVLGGTVNGTTGEWEAPDVAPDIEQSFEALTQRDVVLKIPRGKLKTRIEWPLSKEDLGRVVIKVIVMKPESGKGYMIGKVA